MLQLHVCLIHCGVNYVKPVGIGGGMVIFLDFIIALKVSSPISLVFTVELANVDTFYQYLYFLQQQRHWKTYHSMGVTGFSMNSLCVFCMLHFQCLLLTLYASSAYSTRFHCYLSRQWATTNPVSIDWTLPFPRILRSCSTLLSMPKYICRWSQNEMPSTFDRAHRWCHGDWLILIWSFAGTWKAI